MRSCTPLYRSIMSCSMSTMTQLPPLGTIKVISYRMSVSTVSSEPTNAESFFCGLILCSGAGLVWGRWGDRHRLCGALCHPAHPHRQRHCWCMAGQSSWVPTRWAIWTYPICTTHPYDRQHRVTGARATRLSRVTDTWPLNWNIITYRAIVYISVNLCQAIVKSNNSHLSKILDLSKEQKALVMSERCLTLQLS